MKFFKSLILLSLGALLLTSCTIQPNREDLREYISNNSVKVIGDMGTGSGFFLEIKDKFYVVTNEHVCDTSVSDKINIYDYSTKKNSKAKILERSRLHDLCIIEPSYVPEYAKNFKLRLAKDVKIGQEVVIFGFPLGRPGVMTEGEYVVTEPVQVGSRISDPNEDCKFSDSEKYRDPFFGGWYCIDTFISYEITAAVSPGSSGSGLYNRRGEVIGVIFAGTDRVHNQNYAVPLSYLVEFIDSFENKLK